MARIVVVGAGVAGMAVAARLRVKGHHVTVVEAAETHGGALAALRRDGFAFDLGPGLFTLPAVYRDLFLKTGGRLEDSVELLPIDPGAHHLFPDGALALPGVGVGRTAEAMGAAFGGQAADDWRDLMSRAGQMWATLRRPVLETAVASTSDLAPLLRDRTARRTLAPRRTLRGMGRLHLHDPRARQVLDRYATAAGADPRRAPGTHITRPYVEATFGAWHIAGGLATLGDALRTRLDERGVTVLLGTRVTRILVAGGRVTGVAIEPSEHAGEHVAGDDQPRQAQPHPGATRGATQAGTILAADLVVTDIDPAEVYGHLISPDDAPPAPRRPLRTTPSAAAFHLLLAVRGSTPGLGHTTVWHPERPDAELDAIFGRHPRLPTHPTIQACVPDDPAMRPPGHEAWTLQVTAPRHSRGGREPGTIDWDAPGLAQRYADDLLAELARRGTDLRDRILWREVRTPADLQRRTGAPGGATHGSTTGPRGTLQHTPNASPLAGLFHVGASAHPGAGLPLVGLSAELVANLIGRA